MRNRLSNSVLFTQELHVIDEGGEHENQSGRNDITACMFCTISMGRCDMPSRVTKGLILRGYMYPCAGNVYSK